MMGGCFSDWWVGGANMCVTCSSGTHFIRLVGSSFSWRCVCVREREKTRRCRDTYLRTYIMY